MQNDPPSNSPDTSKDEVFKLEPEDTSELNLWDFDEEEQNAAPRTSKLPDKKGESNQPLRSKKPPALDTKPLPSQNSPPEKPQSVSTVSSVNTPPKKSWDADKPPSPSAKTPLGQPNVVNSLRDNDLGELDPDDPSQDMPSTTKPDLTEDFPKRNEKPPEKIDTPKRLQVTPLEKIGITALLVFLLIAAILGILTFSKNIPTRPIVADEPDLPITGEHITVNELTTFWREPVLTGENRDVVQRGTQLIPVVNLELIGKSAAVRVFFRNEDGIVIGDSLTRSVAGEMSTSVPATAGYDDVGMHAAYRTGENPPWTVQIYEGTDVNDPKSEFTLLVETEVSTDFKKAK